jgi:sulfonate transport system substrate-binding protein
LQQQVCYQCHNNNNNAKSTEGLAMHVQTIHTNPILSLPKIKTALVTLTSLWLLGCTPSEEAATTSAPNSEATPPAAATALAPIRVSGSFWIELSPVLVAANSFYPEKMVVGEGGITNITSNVADLATNAETQLLRETIKNPDLRIIMTVTESFYRLVGRRSAGIASLADLKGKRVMLPGNTSANYFLVAMLRTVGLTDADVQIVPLPPAQGDQSGMDLMSDALAKGEVDVISIWEPEPDSAIKELGDDAIVLQDRSVYREVFNLHARATDLADPQKRPAIVEFVRSVAKATTALKADPAPYWPHVSSITKFSEEEIAAGWPEMEFPIHIIPDMLDVLVEEEPWIAQQQKREPRSREELAKFIDTSVVEEALAGQ